MSSLFSSLAYNFSGQLVARVISFGINMYLLRKVDNDILGIVNVNLTLLYTTALFLTREPFRKGNILKASVPQFVNLLWLSPVLCTLLCLILSPIWSFSSQQGVEVSPVVFWSFPISAIIESLAEPFAVISLRYSLSGHFAIAQSLLIFLKRVFIFLFIGSSGFGLETFAKAQVLSSIVYLLFHLIAFYRYSHSKKTELAAFPSFRSFFPQISHGIDRSSLEALGTLFTHSILKQLLTDGSAYVMTFTELLSLKQQAVFDAVDRVGSLVARTVLAPMEENCFAYFSNIINNQSAVFKKNSDAHDHLINTFTTILHVSCVVGLTACVFGIPYSGLAAFLYGGPLLYDNGGSILLSCYCFYIFIMAVNGITECFAMASMNNSQVFSHGGFLFASAVVHLIMNYILCVYLNAVGFILANSLNMIFRIGYSWSHIRSYLGGRAPPIADVLPTFSTIVYLMFSLAATLFTLLLFGGTPGLSHSAAHVLIGGVLFMLVLLHIGQSDPIFQKIINTCLHQHQQ